MAAVEEKINGQMEATEPEITEAEAAEQETEAAPKNFWQQFTDFVQERSNSIHDAYVNTFLPNVEAGIQEFKEGDKAKGVSQVLSSSFASVGNLLTLGYGNEMVTRMQDSMDERLGTAETAREAAMASLQLVNEDGVRFDSFENAMKGDTKEVCGGTLTYEGKGALYAEVKVDGKDMLHTNSYMAITDEQRGTIVHYQGELGDFRYNTRDFELGYAEDGTSPILHYRGDTPVRLIPGGKASITDGEYITIPDGITDASHMFEGTAITSVPAVPDSVQVTTDMFKGCEGLDVEPEVVDAVSKSTAISASVAASARIAMEAAGISAAEAVSESVSKQETESEPEPESESEQDTSDKAFSPFWSLKEKFSTGTSSVKEAIADSTFVNAIQSGIETAKNAANTALEAEEQREAENSGTAIADIHVEDTDTKQLSQEERDAMADEIAPGTYGEAVSVEEDLIP